MVMVMMMNKVMMHKVMMSLMMMMMTTTMMEKEMNMKDEMDMITIMNMMNTMNMIHIVLKNKQLLILANIWNKSLEESARPWFLDPEKGWPNSVWLWWIFGLLT